MNITRFDISSRVLVALILASFSSALFSQTSTSAANCPVSDYTIAYFNGVNSTYVDASLATLRLRQEFGPTYNGRPLTVARFYNPTDAGLADVGEAFKQATREHPDLEGRWEKIWQVVHGPTPYDYLIDSGGIAIAKASLEKLTELMAKAIAGANPAPTTSQLSVKLQGYISQHRKVIVVAHSQGNFFANSVHDMIAEELSKIGKKVISFIHVATPSATHVEEPYVTNTLDAVIAFVRANLVGVPEPNVTVSLSGILTKEVMPDPLGHNFVATYMNTGYAAYPMVREDIRLGLESLQDYPCDAPNSRRPIVPRSASCKVTEQLPNGNGWKYTFTGVAEVVSDVSEESWFQGGGEGGRINTAYVCGAWTIQAPPSFPDETACVRTGGAQSRTVLSVTSNSIVSYDPSVLGITFLLRLTDPVRGTWDIQGTDTTQPWATTRLYCSKG